MAWNIATNTEKREKWNMHTVGPRIWQKKMKKRGKWESHTVGSGIWQKKKNEKKKWKWWTSETYTSGPEIWQ
jgi:hypothetical protein